MSMFNDNDSTRHGGFSSDFNNETSSNVDQELQDFFIHEKQKAQFNAQVRLFLHFSQIIILMA